MTLTNIMLICIPTKMSRIFFLDTFFSESQIAFSEEEKNLNWQETFQKKSLEQKEQLAQPTLATPKL